MMHESSELNIYHRDFRDVPFNWFLMYDFDRRQSSERPDRCQK